MKKVSFDIYERYIGNDDEPYDEAFAASKRKNAQRLIQKIIDEKLTSRQREVCLMYFFQGQSMVSIADSLGVNKSTVSRTLSRAIKNLQDRLQYYRLR